MEIFFYFLSGAGFKNFPMVYIAAGCIPLFILIAIVIKWRSVWGHGPGSTERLLKYTFIIFCISSVFSFNELKSLDKQTIFMNMAGAGFQSIGNRPFWMSIPDGDKTPETQELERVARNNATFTVKKVSCQDHDCIITVAINKTNQTYDFSLRTFMQSGATVQSSYKTRLDLFDNMIKEAKKGLDTVNTVSDKTQRTNGAPDAKTSDIQRYLYRDNGQAVSSQP